MSVIIIRELPETRTGARQLLVEKDNQHYVVSSLESAFDTAMPETLVFPSDAEGNITDWGEVAGGRYVTRDEAIQELDNPEEPA